MTNETLEADLIEINALPLVTKISRGRVNKPMMAFQKVYDNTPDTSADGILFLEYADDVYVYENALGAHYACYMYAGSYRYFARITPGVDVIITEEGIY